MSDTVYVVDLQHEDGAVDIIGVGVSLEVAQAMCGEHSGVSLGNWSSSGPNWWAQTEYFTYSITARELRA